MASELYNKMYRHQELIEELVQLNNEKFNLEESIRVREKAIFNIEQDLISEIAKSGKPALYFTYSYDKVFCIYPKKVKVINVESVV